MPLKTNENTFTGDLREIFTDEALSSATPVYIYCSMHPDTRRPSMRVYPDGAYCFTCGAYMSRHKLLRHVTEVDPTAITNAKLHSSSRTRIRARPILRREELEVLAHMAHDNLTSSARRYYHGRGLSDATIDAYQLGHYGAGYTLPVFETAERTTVQTMRFRRDDALRLDALDAPDADEGARENLSAHAYAATRQTPKYWGVRGANEVVVYPHPIPPEARAVILTEGEFDALLLRQEGLDAYSLTNGARAWQKIKNWATLLPPDVAIRLCYDNDPAGREAAEALRLELEAQEYAVTMTYYAPETPKDLTELRQRSVEEFRAFANALRLWELSALSQRTSL